MARDILHSTWDHFSIFGSNTHRIFQSKMGMWWEQQHLSKVEFSQITARNVEESDAKQTVSEQVWVKNNEPCCTRSKISTLGWEFLMTFLLSVSVLGVILCLKQVGKQIFFLILQKNVKDSRFIRYQIQIKINCFGTCLKLSLKKKSVLTTVSLGKYIYIFTVENMGIKGVLKQNKKCSENTWN